MDRHLVEKLLGSVFLLEQINYGKLQLRRLLSGAIVMTGLVIMTAISASTMLIGCFYACYLALLDYGLEAQNAIFIASLLFAMVTALFAFLTLMCLHRAQEKVSGKLWQPSSLITLANEAVEAFVEGFNE